MAISIVNKKYSTRVHPTGTTFLLANMGQGVREEIDIVVDFNFTSDASNQALIVATNKIQVLYGTWGTRGFVIGDVLQFTGTVSDGTNTYAFGATTYTITDISGSIMTLSANPFPSWSPSQIMPSISSTSITITNTSRTEPETIEFFHNWIPNTASGGDASLFDGEVNRHRVDGVDAMAVTDTATFISMGNQSGGTEMAYLERLADVGSLVSYRITIDSYSPLGFEDADFNEPSWFEASASLKPYYRIQALPQENNPNSSLALTYSDYLGNVGWFNESYNQGVNEFSIESVSITDASGNPLSEVDYSQVSIVTAVINGPTDFAPYAEINFTLIPDLSLVKNKPERNADLCSVSNSFLDFSGVPSILHAVFGKDDRQMPMSAETLDVAVANKITVQYQLNPSPELTAFIESMSSESRRYRLSAIVESDGGTANDNNAVSLILKEGLLTKAPIIGGRYTGVVSKGFHNHAQTIDDTLSTDYDGCTEDDMLFHSVFNLRKDASWKSLTLAVEVARLSDGANFALTSQIIPFNNFLVDSSGIIQFNYNESVPQFLEAPERNKIELSLNGNSTTETYEVELIWSMMANWRYWLAQANAMPEFIDSALPNMGKSQDWVRYLQEAGFFIRVRCTLTNTDDVAYWWASRISLQNYDDTLDMTSTIEYYDTLDNLQTSLIAGQNMRIKAIHTLASGSWEEGNVWGWIGQRPKENEPNKRISTVWNWSSLSYPFKPLAGETKAKLSFPTPDVAVVECLLDTAMVDVANLTIVSRIETPAEPVCVSPIDWLFNYVEANSDSAEDFVTVLAEVLDGTDVTASNVCCPTCEIVIDGTATEIYAFGTGESINTLVGTFTGDPCCYDSYKLFTGCELGFDTLVDGLMAELTGDTGALLDLVPSQINSFFGNDFNRIQERIISLTTDETIRYAVFEYLLAKGFKMTCAEGVKIISEL